MATRFFKKKALKTLGEVEYETDSIYVTQIERLSGRIQELQNDAISQKILLKVSEDAIEESESLKAISDCLQIEIDNLNIRLINADQENTRAKKEITSLEFNRVLHESKVQAQQDEILSQKELIEKYQTWASNANRSHAAQVEKIESLQNRFQWAIDQAGQPVVDAFQSTKDLEIRVEELERAKKVTESENEEQQRILRAELEAIKLVSATNLQEVLDRESSLQTKIHQLRFQLEDVQSRSVAFELQRDDLSSELASIKKAHKSLPIFANDGFSPRKIIFMELMKDRFPEHTSRSTLASLSFLKTNSIQVLTRAVLDVDLEDEEAKDFQNSIVKYLDGKNILDVFQLKVCACCRVVKLAVIQGSNQLNSINEFLPRFANTSCCASAICTTCLPEALTRSTQIDWWHNLESNQWLMCPIPNCSAFAPVRHVGELMSLVTGLMGTGRSGLMSSFERATTLRSALLGLSSRPSSASLQTASKLHQRLLERGHVFDFFDPMFNSVSFDPETGRTRGFDAGKIIVCDLDASSERIPLFTKFFRRKPEPKECCICAESYHDVQFESEEEWIETCAEFSGKWMWQVLQFPTKAILGCDHTMDTCKTCFERNLSSELEQHGRNGCDRLSCPQCHRRLNDCEIQHLASVETSQKFDHFRLLNVLSAEPKFRWCLREGCENGQLYEDEMTNQQIICEACSFQMCFKHQTPWHQNLTCAQYDSQRQHGDPDHAETETWLTANTKRCPGTNCGVNIEKDAGCFHMTCRSCNHEFCWECLASWSLISPSGGEYRQNSHGVGCFFRTNVLQPTQIAGNDLTQAIARRNRAPT